MRESIIQTMVNKFLTWLSKKSVTALYKQTHFWVFSWGLDENTDLYLMSEESYHGYHRFGLHEETYDHKDEPTQNQHAQSVESVESVEADRKTEPQYDAEEVAKDINRRVDMVKKEWNARHIEDEPQTEREGE